MAVKEHHIVYGLTDYEATVLHGALLERGEKWPADAETCKGLVSILLDQLGPEDDDGGWDVLKGEGYEVDLCERGFVVLATEHAPEREEGEIVAGAYSQRARADRVCRHLNAGWSPAKANEYEWPDGRTASPRPLT